MTDNIDLDSLPGNMTDQQIAELITTNPQAAFEAGWIAGESAARAALASPPPSAVEPVAIQRPDWQLGWDECVAHFGLESATTQPPPPAQAAPVGFNNCINESENFPCRDWCRLPECRSDSATPTQPAAQPAGVVEGIFDALQAINDIGKSMVEDGYSLTGAELHKASKTIEHAINSLTVKP